MLQSLALILICGFILSGLAQKLRLPGLLGMIVTGMILGPHLLNLISGEILYVSADLREIALIVILVRAGLALNLKELKKVGRPATLMSFVPAIFEVAAVTVIGVFLFDISVVEAAIMGAVLAAVSPAVVVPRVLKFMKERRAKKRILSMLMASTSVNGVFVIVLFTSFLGFYSGTGFDVISLVSVPVSILTGAVLGVLVGGALVRIFKRIHMRDTVKIMILFSAAFLFMSLEGAVRHAVPLSGLIATLALSMTILQKYKLLADRLSGKFSKIWVGAELLLFVLIGAAVDIGYIGNVWLPAVVLIVIALLVRTSGVFVSLLGTKWGKKAKLFCAVSSLPKATVQAAIAGIPLAAGVGSGNVILAVAVLAILITAPVGALLMDLTHKKLILKAEKAE